VAPSLSCTEVRPETFSRPQALQLKVQASNSGTRRKGSFTLGAFDYIAQFQIRFEISRARGEKCNQPSFSNRQSR
jgi:hypothetical protein